jgi:hypothetical protein
MAHRRHGLLWINFGDEEALSACSVVRHRHARCMAGWRAGGHKSMVTLLFATLILYDGSDGVRRRHILMEQFGLEAQVLVHRMQLLDDVGFFAPR